MEVNKIRELVSKLPSKNIYELLYYNDIQIIESESLINKKCDSTIVSNNNITGIFIKPDLPEEYKQFLLWHEYGHYCLHYEPDMHFNFYLSRFNWKSEHEANMFAVLALLQNEDLEDKNIIDLAVRNGVPNQIAIRAFDFMNIVQ